MGLVQIRKHVGRIDRVPRGETPIIELQLLDNQSIASIELREAFFDRPERKTVDWTWVAYIATRL